jgi:zeaxanthin glucosyltransferase
LRTLAQRGHTVAVAASPDAAAPLADSGITHLPLAAQALPAGSLAQHRKRFATTEGVRAVREFLSFCATHTEGAMREGDAALAAFSPDALIGDQVEPATSVLAERHGLPLAVVCNALALHRHPDLPPLWHAGAPAGNPFTRTWYRLLHRIGDSVALPYYACVRTERARAGLPPWRGAEHFFARSSLLEVAQDPPSFVDRQRLPPHVHACGPFRDDAYDRGELPALADDDRPLAFVSLGTLQDRRADLLLAVAQAIAQLGWRAIIARSAVVVSHGGLNTVLDALAAARPLVLLPLAFEQPTIAARVARLSAGVVVPPGRRTARGIAEALTAATALGEGARRCAQELAAAGGAVKAADFIERSFSRQHAQVPTIK